jgi:N-acetylglucosaminyldiphosphoundecaprenol N-acetyl-beta-D-mannosaminyltransferase
MDALKNIPDGKVLINTINAHSFNTAQDDRLFAEALSNGDYLIPDGASILKACKWLKAKSQPKERIAGWDLFSFEMEQLERKSEKREVNGDKLKVMFMGSSEKVLSLIKEKAALDYPHLEVLTYSPPYKPEFSEEDNRAIINAINEANPDLLWIGMTAPKQEKWTYSHWKELNIHCHVGTIGAVFDFYAGTAKRAPMWWQKHSLEWLYRLVIEPKRMWRRYVIGNPLFLWNIGKERA